MCWLQQHESDLYFYCKWDGEETLMCHYPNILWVTRHKRKSPRKNCLLPACQPPVCLGRQAGQGHCALGASIQLFTLPSQTKGSVFKAIPFPGLHLTVWNRPCWDQGNCRPLTHLSRKRELNSGKVFQWQPSTPAADASEAGSGLGVLRATQFERCADRKSQCGSTSQDHAQGKCSVLQKGRSWSLMSLPWPCWAAATHSWGRPA